MDTVPDNRQRRLYVDVNVWKKVDENRLLLYRCFHVLPDNKYCVQSADFYSLPLNEKQIRYLFEQFIQLLREEDPKVRAHLFDSLEEAIAAHDRDFL
jgi:hypothetical protein